MRKPTSFTPAELLLAAEQALEHIEQHPELWRVGLMRSLANPDCMCFVGRMASILEPAILPLPYFASGAGFADWAYGLDASLEKLTGVVPSHVNDTQGVNELQVQPRLAAQALRERFLPALAALAQPQPARSTP